MKKYLLVVFGVFLIALLFISVTAVKAAPSIAKDDCPNAPIFGVWDAGSATCLKPLGSCPSGVTAFPPVSYNPGDGTYAGTWGLPTCVPISGNSDGDIVMSTSIQDSGRSDLILGSPANIYIHYAPTTCLFGCTLSTVLFKTANQALKDMDITIYAKARVKIEGNPILNSYRICFITDFLTTATIYKYAGGLWSPTGTTLYDGVACAYGSGSSQFVLGD